jgi:hypothetical protein
VYRDVTGFSAVSAASVKLNKAWYNRKAPIA